MAGSLLVRPEADETGVADRDGVRIAWNRFGDGPETILFVPTWNFVDSRVLRHQVDGLRDRFRLITFDARGSGASDHPATGYTFPDHAADAVAVLDATGTAVASLVGASAGTHTSVHVAVAHPERVRRLVLVAPPMDLPGVEPANREDALPDEPDWITEYPAFVRWFIRTAFPEPGCETTIDEIVAIGLEADLAMLLQQAEEADWDEAPRRLGYVACPTLVLHGTNDATLAVAPVEAVAAAIPDAELRLLDGLGHRPDISRPDVVNPLLAGFVDERG